jgi:hypothetical protein
MFSNSLHPARALLNTNRLQLENSINRRWRRRWHAATAVLALAVWLFMAVAEAYSPLHAWLHGGTIPKDDDDCVVLAIAHGKVEPVACAAPAAGPVTWVEIVPRLEFSVFRPAIAFLPDGRGPPVLPVVS